MNNKLTVPKKNIRGEDEYKVFSVRIKKETITILDDIAAKTERSRNEIINICLNYSIENMEV